MKTCATCRFMAGPRADAGLDYWDEDACDMVSTEHRSCVRIIHGNATAETRRRAANEPAAVVDGSGYAARLIVLPTFGCVLHEERAEAEEVRGG